MFQQWARQCAGVFPSSFVGNFAHINLSLATVVAYRQVSSVNVQLCFFSFLKTKEKGISNGQKKKKIEWYAVNSYEKREDGHCNQKWIWKVEIFGLNVLPMRTGSSVVRLPREHRKSDISHLFLHKPTVNIHFLKTPNPTWRVNTFTRLIRQMLYKVQYTFNTLLCTSLFLSQFAYIHVIFLKK